MPPEKIMVARVGRENQCYSPVTGARMVAGTIALNQDRSKVLMVSSQAHKDRWVLPKGGIETDEVEDPSKSAVRETWEEAGVTGHIVKSLGVIEDVRPPKTWIGNDIIGATRTWPPRSEFHFFELMVEKEEDVWPESSERKRKWAGFQEARQELLNANRLELIEALERSSILRS
ncbi:hypothetical protein NADFUDRAFT_48584 [Nadsonia fulvescens var. elongata DSM 6958]|uniref:Nudix hydrolase domain-containing protein n=1 Tax=Nadsonia fulvescens var. elongata DSM 6958 TaxID=857566 RepID=A0A1E3PRQ8_9ASCO|nr:hypothetical protein NADFUDRAFT_48584 [Nadsonia fulvescens var. elongata DSM 6958]